MRFATRLRRRTKVTCEIAVYADYPVVGYLRMAFEPEVSGQSNVEEYAFSKDKLPKAFSYPLKRSLLDAALRFHSVYPTVWYVVYAGRPYENVLWTRTSLPKAVGV